MRLDEEQITQLWRQKLHMYINGENKKSGETILLLLILMFGVASITQFDRRSILNIGVFYLIYFLALSILNRLTKHYKSTKYRRKKTFYILPLLLRFVQDWNLLAMLDITSWVMWTNALGRIINKQQISQFSFFLFIGIFVLSFLFSPFVLRNKIASLKDQSFKYYVQGSTLATILPGIVLFLVTLIPSIEGISTSTLIIIFTSFLSWLILLPFFVWGGYEILALSLNEWPSIKKNGNDFIVSFVDDEET